MFFALDRNTQKRLLKKTKELAIRETKSKKSKSKFKLIYIPKTENKKKLDLYSKMDENKQVFFQSLSKANTYDNQLKPSQQLSDQWAKSERMDKRKLLKGTSKVILETMLLGTKASELNENDQNDFQKMLQEKEIRRTSKIVVSKVKNGLSKSRAKSAYRKKAAMDSIYFGKDIASKSTRKSSKKISEMLSKSFAKMASNPVTMLVLMVVLLIGIIGGVMGAIVGAGGAEASGDSERHSSYQCQVSENVEKLRGIVEKYAESYNIPEFVDVIMAIIQQESSGVGIDVMQSSESGYGRHNPVLSQEESIDAGVHVFADCLKAAKCESPSDINTLSLALQGYNFGKGYISWAVENYGGYSKENAATYSAMMVLKLGWLNYGDMNYVQHVLRYYVKNESTVIANADASEILEELEENNDVSEEVWKVIYKGASLIGKVTYSMDKRQGDGRANPEYLDCSSFTAWAFHKGGITCVPYNSTTATFIGSNAFTDISANDLRPGDIGLISKTAPPGGANHVGIYCGKLKDGTKVWMHCTNCSPTSLTGNTSGAMFGVYSGFGYFRRLKSWND